jgi:BNR repeat-like domain
MRVGKRLVLPLALAVAAFAFTASIAGASPPSFNNTTLFGTWNPAGSGLTIKPAFPGSGTPPNSTGDSEPAIAFSDTGTMAVDGLGWLPFQVNVWTGTFGSTPTYLGGFGQVVPNHGNRLTLGDEDADIDFTSAGTLLLAELDVTPNPKFSQAQFGVDVTRCTNPSDASTCTNQVLDQTNSDRPWITHRGMTVWVSYHDSGNSSLIHVQRSTDDGRTWHQVSSPIVGNGGSTGSATFNSQAGPIVADPNPNSNFLYDIYDAGLPQTKGHSSDFNNIFVSRSTDGGRHWEATLVDSAPVGSSLDNIFPSLAVDQTTGTVYAVWTDSHTVWVSNSTDHGKTWSDPTDVSTGVADLATTLMPWVAARDGKVDVVFYGSTSAQDDTSAVWNTYDSQFSGGSWSIDNLVSNSPNRIGAVCTEGSACAGNTNRELLDLFEVAEDPLNDKAAIVYTSSEISTYTTPDTVVHKLPEIVLAFEH